MKFLGRLVCYFLGHDSFPVGRMIPRDGCEMRCSRCDRQWTYGDADSSPGL